MGDGFQINGFVKIKQYKKDGTVIRDEKLYNKVTDIGRQWFLHKGSSPILQNNFANFSQSDFYSHMDCNVTMEGNVSRLNIFVIVDCGRPASTERR